MNHKALLSLAKFFLPCNDLNGDSLRLPADGAHLLKRFLSEPNSLAACMEPMRLAENVHLSDHTHASSVYFADRKIKAICWNGDLTIDGDLIDDDWEALPVLIVAGNLSVRNWLRGGMIGFIGGSVFASGFIIGHYNDSALFVGGDLRAAGYIPCAKPYRDLPDVAPHQIAGGIDARTLDGLDDSIDLTSVFVDDVLEEAADAEESRWIDPQLIFERVSAGLPVWKK